MKTWARLNRLPVFLAATWLWSCQSPVNPDDPGSTVPGSCNQEAPLLPPQKTDILFVIDNSGSMAEEQQGIANELPAFLEELQKGGGVAQDFQVGVITTAVYEHSDIGGTVTLRDFPEQSGRLRPVPNTNPPERILRGDDPAVLDRFRELIKQGVGGSGQETPFEALRLALTSDPLLTENEGLLRDDARLLVVIVTDEDDCSETARPPQVKVGNLPNRDYCSEQSGKLTPVADYHALFSNLKTGTGETRQLIWSVIGPVARGDKSAQAVLDGNSVRNVDCPTSYQPGYRHRAMASLFDPSLTNLDSICRENYRETLLTIAALANQRQDLAISGVPDPALLKIEITRSNDQVQNCTLLNDGIRYEPGTVFFQNQCLRRGDDKAVAVKLLCAS